jgi:glycosyltransferase involved in cell wall biosynthesis
MLKRAISIIQYWGGCPEVPNSKWRRFLHLLRACSERGWRTHLVWSHLPRNRELVSAFEEFGCRIHLQPRARGNFDPMCVLRTYRLLRRVGCDVFHCHNVHTSPLVGSTLAGAPVRVWSKLSMSSQYEEGRKPTGWHRMQASHHISCALAHAVICPTPAVRNELREQGLPANKLRVIPSPIELDRFVAASPAGVREGLGIPDHAVLITAVGHAVPVKGWDVLIRAFSGIAGNADNIHLLLVGSTDAPGERETFALLQGTVANLRIGSRVRFAGPRKDIPAVLAASDIFVMPSRSEGQGLALVEALSSGLPCVAAAVGGIPSFLRHQENGLLFEREDSSALAAALLEMVRNDRLRSRLAARARPSVDRLGLEVGTRAELCLYDHLLQVRGHGY